MLTIITPCYRQANLPKLFDSIQFDKLDKWIIVYDTSNGRTYNKLYTKYPKILEVENVGVGVAGQSHRNVGMKLVEDGFLYFLDDDNIVHPTFWSIVQSLDHTYFYTFDQLRDCTKSILYGNKVRVKWIDTAMFIVHKRHIGDTTWDINRYDADGYFICTIYNQHTEAHRYISTIGCYYNYLDQKPTHYGGKHMNSFPQVLLFRHAQYEAVDTIFHSYTGAIDCSIDIVLNPRDLMAMFDVNYPIVVTYGALEEYLEDIHSVLPDRMRTRWVHMTDIQSVPEFVRAVTYCYIHNVLSDRTHMRPIFSIFTTCYNSFTKILRAYESIRKQTFRDWEWVILDDSPENAHFEFITKLLKSDTRIRLYKRSHNSGNIGNVKNEAVSLCRGKYLLEMDHDDEILPDLIADAVRVFTEHPGVGYVYMDFINLYEDGGNFFYSDCISKGYGGYYKQKYKDKWVNVYMTPNINNITMSHIVSIPNHPRIWKRECIMEIGNYSEFLPINDDQELQLRTILTTTVAKIPKLAYIQYMNANSNNFSLIRNGEINRLGTRYIVPQFYERNDVHGKMKELDAHEDEQYLHDNSPVWTRESYTHKFCNKRIQYDYDIQYCVLGIDTFVKHIDLLKTMYENPRFDCILLDTTGDRERLCTFLDTNQCSRMKCYSMANTTPEQLKRYFHMLYKCCDQVMVLE